MKTKRKRWSEMTTEELAVATKQFDDPSYDPPPRKPSKRQLAQPRRVQPKAAKNRFRVAIPLEGISWSRPTITPPTTGLRSQTWYLMRCES